MLDSVCLSLVNSDHHATGISSLLSRCETDILLRAHECNLNFNRGAQRLLYRCSSQKYGSLLRKNLLRPSRLRSLPLCNAQFNEFNINAVGSSTLKETADGDTSLELHGFNDNGGSTVAEASLQPSVPDQRDSRAFNHDNTVGIIGGLNSLATVDFMRKIIDASNAVGESDHIPVLLCSDPNLRKRIAATRGPTKSNFNPALLEPAFLEPDETELLTLEPLLQKRRFLEGSGAKCIVMPCHVSHLWYDELAKGCTVPFLHMADCVIQELKAANLQPLEAGTRPKIGVLGSEATLASGFYQEKLRSEGFDVALPDKATMEHAVIPGIAALQRRDIEGARNLLRIAVQVLLVNAVNMVVLACHNIPTAFSADDPVLRKCIDPTDALARATVRWSKNTRGGSL